MTENKYWSAFRKYLVPRVYVWKINAGFVAGVPDWWGSGSEQDLWVENKRIDGKIPAILDLTNHDKYLTVRQQMWLRNRYNEGRSVGVVVFSEEGHVYFHGLEWETPISKLEFIQRAVPYKELAEHLINFMGELK